MLPETGGMPSVSQPFTIARFRLLTTSGSGFRYSILAALIICFYGGFATASQASPEANTKTLAPHSGLQQKTSSLLLPAGTLRLGGSTAWGVSDRITLGTDLVPLFAGAYNAHVKGEIYAGQDISLTLGLEAFRVTRSSLLGGAQKNAIETLDLSSLHPRLILTRRLSDRMLLHTAWEGGRNWGEIILSEEGKDAYRRSPQKGLFSHQSVLLMALLGFTQESFEVSGEWQRSPHETLILGAHIARYQLESLRAEHFGIRMAQQWQGKTLGFRLGAGLLYQKLYGTNLAQDRLDDGRILPLAEFDVYLLLR